MSTPAEEVDKAIGTCGFVACWFVTTCIWWSIVPPWTAVLIGLACAATMACALLLVVLFLQGRLDDD